MKKIGHIDNPNTPPPWETIPPELEVYRERGHRRLAARTYASKLDNEAMLGTVNDWMDIFDVKEQFDDDFSAADFFHGRRDGYWTGQTIIRELPGRFRKWVCTLKPTNAVKPLVDGLVLRQGIR